MRKFEKISFEQFKKDVSEDDNLYNAYEIPRRKTKNSAGYDLCSLIEYDLRVGESVIIPTGIKSVFPVDETLLLVIRSSLGFKHNIRLVNQVGIVDADYYNNANNEGHIMLKVQNEGQADFKINLGDAIAQGIFVKFGVVDDEEEIISERKGGFGSTSKGE